VTKKHDAEEKKKEAARAIVAGLSKVYTTEHRLSQEVAGGDLRYLILFHQCFCLRSFTAARRS